MWDFIAADANGAFSFAVGLVFVIGICEGLAVFTGMSVLGMLDDWLDIDGLSGADVSPSLFGSALGWLSLGRLPLLIWLVLALTSFAIIGYSCNFIGLLLMDQTLPSFVTVPISLSATLFSCRYVGKLIAYVLPSTETSAVSVETLSGRAATIIQGCAVKGLPAEALVVDGYQQKHYVLVEPDADGIEFRAGTQVVLLEHLGRVWTAMLLDSPI
jgi:hypothetical protein